jgi:Meiotic cell cortex C-terminal pleckstrin homology
MVFYSTVSEQFPSTCSSQETYITYGEKLLMVGVVTGVLDVRDDTPLTTSSSNSGLPTPAHGRSIVVLTPTQAIKFTALTRDRHIAWLTAFNFIVHNDPADLIIPRPISASTNHGPVWSREPTYPRSATASSIASSQGTSHQQFVGSTHQHQFNSYSVRKNSLPDFVPVHPLPREDASPLGHKQRYDDQYAIPPSVPRIPTGRRFEGERERSGSASGSRDWEDPTWQAGRETIRMDAFVKRTAPRLELDIDDALFREF